MSSMNGQKFDFSHLRIDDATARIDLDPWLGPGGHLIVRPATEANREYSEALMASDAQRNRIVARARGVAGTGKPDTAAADQERAEEVELYAQHVVVGGLARSKSGEMVEVARGDAGDLLRAIAGPAPYLFDRIRVFCMRSENFIGAPAPVDADPSELAKN